MKRTGVGGVHWYWQSALVDSQEGLSLSTFVEFMSVTVVKVLGYVVGRLSGVICFTAAAPLHHLLQPGTRVIMSDYSVYDV